MNNVIYITGGVIIFVILIILYITPDKKNEDSAGYLQHQDSLVDSRMLLHSVQLSAEIYRSFYMNREYWKNNLKEPVLIYRYPQYMCKSCYNEDIEELLSFQEEAGKDKVLVLPAFEDNKENRISLNNELAKFNYINTPLNLLKIPDYQYEENQQRYFAVLNKEGEISMVFFPRFGYKRLTNDYFSEVKKVL
ncbi:MAG: hypothetical protein LBR26_04705 [Prevotella sp.]|nr:hypothetical protein [Prevotella sp.]